MKRGRLAPVSKKRRAEQPIRKAVRDATLARQGYDCAAMLIVPEIACGGPLDVDERKSRGVYPGGHLDETNTQALCRNHHRWRTDKPEEAWQRGLRVKAWEHDPRILDVPAATIPVPEPLQGATPLQPHRHVAARGTVDWMCKAIEMNRVRHYSIQSMLDAGIDIPDDVIEAAAQAPDGPFTVTDCFCAVDPRVLLDGLGVGYRVDDLGDLVA